MVGEVASLSVVGNGQLLGGTVEGLRCSGLLNRVVARWEESKRRLVRFYSLWIVQGPGRATFPPPPKANTAEWGRELRRPARRT